MPLPDPIGKQREVVYLDHLGHSVVLGTAGSGKTTMAVRRAAYLSNPDTAHGGPTLLLSFNNSLLAYLAYLRPPDLEEVDMRTYHRFARGYLNSRGKMGGDWIVPDDRVREDLLSRALGELREKSPDDRFLRRPDQFFFTETRWIAQQGITTLDDYLAIERIGRGDEGPLGPRNRKGVFAVLEGYHRYRDEAGYQYDWYDIASAVHDELSEDEEGRKYRHIVIDEGQDFTPAMLRSLAAAIPVDGSLTFFGDVAQQIYGRRISWRQAGLEINAPWRFERNYRNTLQIANLGLEIAEMPYFGEKADMVAPTESNAEGPLPALVECESRQQEIELAIEQARAASKAASVAVLVRRREDLAPFARAFGKYGRKLHRKMKNWSPDPGVSYGTVHNAKGYEFDTVILVGLSDDRWPDPAAVTAEGTVDASANDGRLLYVGVTRARSALIVTYSGARSELLPPREELWAATNAELLSA